MTGEASRSHTGSATLRNEAGRAVLWSSQRVRWGFQDEGAMMVDRRDMLAVLAGALAIPAGAAPPAGAQSPGMSRVTAYAFSFAGLSGGEIRLADYAGKPILIVNTASLCGF